MFVGYFVSRLLYFLKVIIFSELSLMLVNLSILFFDIIFDPNLSNVNESPSLLACLIDLLQYFYSYFSIIYYFICWLASFDLSFESS